MILFAGAATLGVAALSSVNAYAWDAGAADPNDTPQTIQGKESATVTLDGTFKEFDPTTPIDPTDPPIDPTDPAWIDVKVPTTVVFGQTDVSKAGIISPTYEIENLSAQGVKVSVKSFTNGTDADKLPNMTLALDNTTSSTSVSLVDPTTAPTFPSEVASLANTGDKINFELSGEAGTGYTFDKEVNPQYTMELQFEVI